jgi:hypothetical protein
LVTLAVLVGAAVAVAIPATAADRPARTRELRSAVPMGKSDAEFGQVLKMPAGRATPPSTPLAVRLRASGTPRLGQPFTIELQVHAYEAAPLTRLRITLPEGGVVVSGSTTATVDLAKGQTRSLSIVAKLTNAGQNEIDGNAFRQVRAGESWGDVDQLFFTVGAERSRVGYKSATGNVRATARQVSGTASSRAGSPRATATFNVCWNLINRAGGTTPFRDALVLLGDHDDVSAPDVLAQGFTNNSGCITFNGVNTSDADEGGLIDPFFEIQTLHTGRYRVESYNGGIYFCDTQFQANTGGNFNFGTWNCGGTTGLGRAFTLFDDIYLLRRFINEHAVNLGFGSPVADCTVRWQVGGTDGTYYTTSDHKVHLSDANQRSRDITLHECSHRQMDVLYGGFPATDCPSPHFLSGVSGKVCAWTEGWTYVNTAGADGNPQYTFDDGSSLNLETANCNTANMDDGSKVEARVGGTLIDLMDPFTNSVGSVSGFSNETSPCGGNDTVSGEYGHIWALLSEQNDKVFIAQEGENDSFSRAWKAKADQGYPQASALAAGKVNSIPNFTKDSAPK